MYFLAAKLCGFWVLLLGCSRITCFSVRNPLEGFQSWAEGMFRCFGCPVICYLRGQVTHKKALEAETATTEKHHSTAWPGLSFCNIIIATRKVVMMVCKNLMANTAIQALR